MHWTKPYYGLSHCGNLSDIRRSTIQELDSCVILSKWFKGCGFSPVEAIFNSVPLAKQAGENWINNGI